MKKHKLSLDELRVESFVTSFDAHHDGTVKGGINDDHVTTIPTRDTPIYRSTGVSTPELTETRFTFMEADTGGCQHTDIGCRTVTLTQL
ncbi:MAG: pinensin family lanthipeptide [Cyclobacteriaceae bacterium]